VRIWAFGEGFVDGFQPSAGTFNESRLEDLDYVIYRAKADNIRVLLTLGNNWQDYGGKNQYVTWVGQSDPDIFYTSPDAIHLYENYINTLLTRKNIYTNTSYADEPTILAWDLMNEPSLSNAENAQNLVQWVNTISSFVRSKDPNHLITVGMNGGEDPTSETLFLNTCSIRYISFCSIHTYPLNGGTLNFPTLNDLESYITKMHIIATAAKKPFVIEEFGIPKNETIYGESSIDSMDSISQFILSTNTSGLFIWNWSLTPDSSFGFSPNDQEYNVASLKKVLGIK
jgi:mannan endo-1,4-beta-mannosidase